MAVYSCVSDKVVVESVECKMLGTFSSTNSRDALDTLAHIIAHSNDSAVSTAPHQLHPTFLASVWIFGHSAYDFIIIHFHIPSLHKQETITDCLGRIEHRIIVCHCIVNDAYRILAFSLVADLNILPIVLLR